MNKQIIVCALVALSLYTATVFGQPAAKTARDTQTVQHLQKQLTTQVDLQYLLFLPKGYKSGDSQKWPLMLFLHGAGERGSDIWKVAVHGPPKYVNTHPDFPFILISPQCAEGQIWSNDALLALLEEITGKYSVDATRVYLTGLSMGGYGTWNLGLSNPDRFAAIVPICGGGQLITVLLANGGKGATLKSLGVSAFT